ncbi:MAG: acyl-phosphate glycerol 3-phosphate acyltransferase [Desulfobulbus propionicus]|nr:MAG: acyl-phosphate glycerol 3-phosphate acyltransferase [Desulfobulbus propionicus]
MVISLLLIIGSYLVGSIPFGLVLSRGSGIDIRTQGSKNIGATNVTRLLGKRFGALTLLFDVLKGFLPIYITGMITAEYSGTETVMVLCGATTILGHMYPLYLRFKGGKGVATALGVFLYLSPLGVLGALLFFAATVALSGYVSLGSLIGSAAILPFLLILDEPSWKLFLAVLSVTMIWIKHHQNISRLLSGTEKSWKRSPEET